MGKMDEFDIHSRFDGFNLNNGFNEEYSNFFMKYFNTIDFMKTLDEDGDELDLMASSYNNFDNVKKFYPNKKINTNRNADKLLPVHVMCAIRSVAYNEVDEGNEELALIVGKYGYTQAQFEEIQKAFNIGKNINENDMKLFISKDDKSNIISYELLDKNNPLGVVLGNITNCCQVIDGAGQSCVEYGITKPNSKFMTFNYNNTIIGQSWIWYDEESKTICLDNIEVPTRFLGIVKNDKNISNSFIQCLKRVAINFKEEMKNHNLEVEHVTIGQGYNDIKEVLNNNFQLSKEHYKLNDYGGYSDAHVQYSIIGG